MHDGNNQHPFVRYYKSSMRECYIIHPFHPSSVRFISVLRYCFIRIMSAMTTCGTTYPPTMFKLVLVLLRSTSRTDRLPVGSNNRNFMKPLVRYPDSRNTVVFSYQTVRHFPVL